MTKEYENGDSGLNALGDPRINFTPEELPVYLPVVDNVTGSDLGASSPIQGSGVTEGYSWHGIQLPRGIAIEGLRLAEKLPEIDPKQPTNSERLRMEAIFERKKANRYLKHVAWKAGRPKLRKKPDARKTRWQKLRNAKRAYAKHLERRHAENRKVYWDLKLLHGIYYAAKLSWDIAQPGVWQITEEEWEDWGVEVAVGDVLDPKLYRTDTKKPWTIENLYVRDGAGRTSRIVWDGNSELLARLMGDIAQPDEAEGDTLA